MRNLVLIGFMGCGKTTLGRLCAAHLGYTFRDIDHIIEAEAGCSVAELFARVGESQFRQKEREVIADLCVTSGLVIATGGGAVLDPLNRENLRRNGLVVLLHASPDLILRRVGNARTRPLLANAPDPRARIEELLEQRLPLYRAAAHCQVDTNGRSSRDVVQQIMMLYELTIDI